MSSPSTIAAAPASSICTTATTTFAVAITPTSTPVSSSQTSPSSPKSQRMRSLSRSRLFADGLTTDSLNTSRDSYTAEFSSNASEFSTFLSTTSQSPSSISVTSTTISSNLPTSSAPMTTPTSSLMDSYLAMSLISPSSPSSSPCVTTTTTFSAGKCLPSTVSSSEPDILSILCSQLPASTPLQHEPIFENQNVPPIAVVPHSISPNLHVSTVNSSTPLPHVVSNHVPPYEFPAIPLWRKKLPPSETASNDISLYEPDPIGLQHVLTFLVNKVDGLSAQYDELASKTDIMQNSMFETLDRSIDTRLTKVQETLNSKISQWGNSTIEACSEVCTDLEKIVKEKVDECTDLVTNVDKKLDKKLDEVSKANVETRKVWDLHMEEIRKRVDESEDEGDNELDHVDLQYFDHKMADLSQKLDDLIKYNHKFDQRLIKLEQYTRRDSLVFSGIPSEIPQEFLQRTILNVMFHLGFNLGPDDIQACHRLWSPADSTEPAKVIVKFVSRKIVEWSLAHQENLQFVKLFMGLDLTMSPSLCDKNTESSNICKWLKDHGLIHNFFLRNGFAKIVVNRGGNAVKVTHPDHIRKRFPNAGIPDVFP